MYVCHKTWWLFVFCIEAKMILAVEDNQSKNGDDTMKIFVAGATGVIGRQLLPRLIEVGHEATAMTRSDDSAKKLRVKGAKAVVCNVFDRQKLTSVMVTAQPDVVIHQLTALPERIDPRTVSRDLVATNRVRTEGTRNLIEAAKAAGVKRFIAQGFSPYYAPTSSSPATEDEPLYTDAHASFVNIINALHNLEEQVLNIPEMEGIVLRYGFFYGPGSAYNVDGTFAEDVLNRKVPIIGNGAGTFSFVHVADAAEATVLAITKGTSGIYNIADDDPAPITEWLPIYAKLIDAPNPMRLPKFIGRLAAGRFAIFFMTQQRGASNQKAKQLLGWKPMYASWRDGFKEVKNATQKANVA